MSSLGGGVPERVVRFKRSVVRPERLEPVPQSQEMLPFVFCDANKVVEKGPGEMSGDGGVAAEASDDVPGLLEGKKRKERKCEFFLILSFLPKNLDLERGKKIFFSELTRSIAQLSI